MPRWGERMDDLDAVLEEQRGIPLQFGPGLEAIWPSDALSDYEHKITIQYRDRIERADSIAEITSILDEARDEYSTRVHLIARVEYRHLKYAFNALLKMAEQRAEILRYAQPQREATGTMRSVDLYQHRPQRLRPAYLEQMVADQRSADWSAGYQRSRIGNPAASALGGMVAAASPVVPANPPQYAQGTARGHWTGGAVGRHPGYVTRRH